MSLDNIAQRAIREESAKYNGWTNYATWRVNLEMFDGMNLEDLTGQTEWDTGDLAEYLKYWAEVNKELSKKYKPIMIKGPAPSDADQWNPKLNPEIRPISINHPLTELITPNKATTSTDTNNTLAKANRCMN